MDIDIVCRGNQMLTFRRVVLDRDLVSKFPELDSVLDRRYVEVWLVVGRVRAEQLLARHDTVLPEVDLTTHSKRCRVLAVQHFSAVVL